MLQVGDKVQLHIPNEYGKLVPFGELITLDRIQRVPSWEYDPGASPIYVFDNGHQDNHDAVQDEEIYTPVYEAETTESGC